MAKLLAGNCCRSKPYKYQLEMTNTLVQFNSIQFNSIQFNSIQFNSIQFNSIQYSQNISKIFKSQHICKYSSFYSFPKHNVFNCATIALSYYDRIDTSLVNFLKHSRKYTIVAVVGFSQGILQTGSGWNRVPSKSCSQVVSKPV